MNENTAAQIASYEQNAAETAKIIKNKITDDLFKNVKNINELSVIWEWLCTICTQIKQNIVYAELCSLLLHSFTVKALDHENSINTCFDEVNSLIKKIRAAVSVEWNVWNDIALITVLEELSEKYDL